MNIQQYYRSVANASLHGSFAAIFPVIVFILPFYLIVPIKEMIFLAVPFLIYSFISYQFYILYRDRSLSSSTPTLNRTYQNITDKNYLLTFLPAPSLRMLLFHPEGYVKYEIRDLRYIKLRWFLPYFLDRIFPAEYGLYDGNGRLLAKVRWVGSKAFTFDSGNRLLFTIEEKSNQYYIAYQNRESIIEIDSKALYTDIKFKNDQNQTFGRVRKGWMPVEWGKFFKDANTPVLTFEDGVNENEKLCLFTLLIKLYRYRNH